MNSLPVRILAAVITFILGVAITNIWLTTWNGNPVICPLPVQTPTARLEMVFVIDTTGSMNGLLDAAKQRIWGIVNGVMRDRQSSVRVGLVAYRDRGDSYVTQVLPLTEDLDKVYITLMDYRAAGGGDEAEDVRTALVDGVFKSGWSTASPGLSQIIFLVGDAPPHSDYADVPDTLTTASNAVRQHLIVNAIQCGSSDETKRAFQSIADIGHGQYFAIGADGGAVVINSPYDEQLGDLASQLGATFVAYGFGAGAAGDARRAQLAMMTETAEARVATSASSVAKAERAYNKVVNSEAYVGDLLQAIENGSLTLDAIDAEQLPENFRAMSPAQRKQEIEKRLAIRRDLRHQILLLSQQRDDYIATQRKKLAGDDGFDEVVAKALREQMAHTIR
jgi:hypothetical protein